MMDLASHFTAVVLAAGTSTRMGTAKQLLRLDDRPLLQHVLDCARASGAKEIVLVLGFAAEETQRGVDVQNVRVVLNESYRQGMGTSLKAGLSAVDPQCAGALIVLADQPFVRPATLDLLMEIITSNTFMVYTHDRTDIVSADAPDVPTPGLPLSARPAHEVHSYRELLKKIAALSFHNSRFRGQLTGQRANRAGDAPLRPSCAFPGHLDALAALLGKKCDRALSLSLAIPLT